MEMEISTLSHRMRLILVLFALAGITTAVNAGLGRWPLASISVNKPRKAGKKTTKKESAERAASGGKAAMKDPEAARFLVKLLPAKDDCYLIEFHTDDNDHAAQMEPVLKRLEEDLQTKVRRVNISRRREFYSLMEAMGHDECGQLPFYYNRKTAQAVCGATSYLNLKRWGTGDLKHLFQDPPENMFEQEVDNSRKRKVGFSGFFQEKLVGADMAGEEKAEKRTAKKSTERIEPRRASREKTSSDSVSEPVAAAKGKASAKGRKRKAKAKAKAQKV